MLRAMVSQDDCRKKMEIQGPLHTNMFVLSSSTLFMLAEHICIT